MKKIMFNDRYGLTEAVLNGRKTQHWDICLQPPYRNYAIAFPASVVEDEYPEKNPLYGSFCWYNSDDTNERTEWIKPKYRLGEVVAVAQSYKDAGFSPNQKLYRSIPEIDGYKIEMASSQKGWINKMFVATNLMPHQIRITCIHLSRPQKFSDEDCLKEGIEFDCKAKSYYCCFNPSTGSKKWLGNTPREAFAALIDKVSGKGTWESNPFVFVYDFELIK